MNGFVETSLTYNAIIVALASRRKYANEAIQKWRTMLANGVSPNKYTIVAVLKATAQLGDIPTAVE